MIREVSHVCLLDVSPQNFKGVGGYYVEMYVHSEFSLGILKHALGLLAWRHMASRNENCAYRYQNKELCFYKMLAGHVRSRKLTKRQIICQSADFLSFYKSDYL